MADADRWRRAHEIAEAERDQARASLRRLRDETDFDLFTVRNQLKQCRREREQMTRDRDEWKARAETAERERDAWRSEAESVRRMYEAARDRERALLEVVPDGPPDGTRMDAPHLPIDADDDPAVFVVRESDIAAVGIERDKDQDWTIPERGWGWVWHSTAEELRNYARENCDRAAACEAVARAIEAEQAVDPVEELAEKIETATRAAIRQACDDLAGVAPPLDPRAVEQAMEVTAVSRKVAAHVLGQEARDGVDR